MGDAIQMGPPPTDEQTNDLAPRHRVRHGRFAHDWAGCGAKAIVVKAAGAELRPDRLYQLAVPSLTVLVHRGDWRSAVAARNTPAAEQIAPFPGLSASRLA